MSNPAHDPFYASPFGPFYRRHAPYAVQPEYRIYELNKRLQARTEVSSPLGVYVSLSVSVCVRVIYLFYYYFLFLKVVRCVRGTVTPTCVRARVCICVFCLCLFCFFSLLRFLSCTFSCSDVYFTP